jgi:hypothetical protein
MIMKSVFTFLGRCFGAAFVVGVAWLYWAHIEILPSGYARLVYEEGDLLHRLLVLLNIA